MSTEVVKEAKLEEEPRQCTKKEKLGHAIGVLGHDSMYTLWSTWTTPFLTDILKLPAGFLDEQNLQRLDCKPYFLF